jgi:hypothetical protein
MPILIRDAEPCDAIFDPEVRHVPGIPMQFFVRPVARQGGVFVDMPKGFELPTCMVDPCCPEDPPA